jgi:hypothetical protein
VLGVLVLALGLASFAVWFQWGQTRRCLTFFGVEAARRIQSAPRVELWSLAAEPGAVRRTAAWDVSQAAGLVHLRRGLVEDVNYRWEPVPAEGQGLGNPAGGQSAMDAARPLGPGVWTEAIVFRGDADGDANGDATTLAFDLDGGWMTVVGRPGRVRLGPIGPGLRNWVEATRRAVSDEKSGF